MKNGSVSDTAGQGGLSQIFPLGWLEALGSKTRPAPLLGGNPQLELPGEAGEVMNVVISSRLPCSQRRRQNVRGRGQKENGSPWFKRQGKSLFRSFAVFLSTDDGVFYLPYNVALPHTRILKQQMLTLAGARGPLRPVAQSPGCAPSALLPHVRTQVIAWRIAAEFKDRGGAGSLELLQGSGRRCDPTF